MTASGFSSAIFTDAQTAPPDETPALMPSSRAKRRAVFSASICGISIIRSTRFGSKIVGKYSCGQRRIPAILEPSEGCKPTI